MPNMLAYIGIGYISLSTFFFIFPYLLHKKKKYHAQILNDVIEGKKFLRIAHRGGPQYTTQNTVQAFRKVIHSTDMLEMDVCETLDGVLIVHHDRNLQRTCGVQKLVSQCKYSDLPPFKDQIKVDFMQNQTVTTNNQKIPTLQKVYQMFPGTLMNIQLKTPTDSAMKQFARLTYQYQRQDYTICGIRNNNNKKFTEQNPHILSFMNDKIVAKLFASYFLGLAPFINLPYNSLQIPVYSEQTKKWALQKFPVDQHWKLKTFFVFLRFINFTAKPLIWHLKKRGIMTYLWVCNNQEAYDRALNMGGQGIMTDKPFELSKYLKDKKIIQ